MDPHPSILFVKTIEEEIRLCTVLFFFKMVALKIWVFFIFFNLFLMGGGRVISSHNR